MKVLVSANSDREVRVAHALSSEPGIELALLGRAKSSRIPSVTEAAGFEVVIGESAEVLALADGVKAAAVTSADLESSPVPAVAGASLLGAALAIAARLESEGADVLRIAVAEPGNGSLGGITVNFPGPIGQAKGTQVRERPYPVVLAASPEPWAAITIEANTGTQAVVDEQHFLRAVCLAAGIALLPPAGVVKVWDAPGPYLAKAEEMGLVAAQRR
ncbi:MAG TPA: hypothetical protein VIA81_07865 [Acidimicrobiia bacterium]